MKKTVLLIGLTFILFFNVGCEDSGGGNDSFSIIGSWNYYYLSNGNWVSNNINWDFRNDGRIYMSNGTNFYYYYCDTKNYLSYSYQSVNENCDCDNSSTTIIYQKLTFEGSDTFFMTYCNENSPWVKFTR